MGLRGGDGGARETEGNVPKFMMLAVPLVMKVFASVLNFLWHMSASMKLRQAKLLAWRSERSQIHNVNFVSEDGMLKMQSFQEELDSPEEWVQGCKTLSEIC